MHGYNISPNNVHVFLHLSGIRVWSNLYFRWFGDGLIYILDELGMVQIVFKMTLVWSKLYLRQFGYGLIYISDDLGMVKIVFEMIWYGLNCISDDLGMV